MELTVKLVWDDEACRWHSDTNNDEVGIVLESNSFEALIERLKIAVPELVELNTGYKGDIRMKIEADRTDTLRAVNYG